MMAGGVEDLRIQYSNLIYSPEFEGINNYYFCYYYYY